MINFEAHEIDGTVGVRLQQGVGEWNSIMLVAIEDAPNYGLYLGFPFLGGFSALCVLGTLARRPN